MLPKAETADDMAIVAWALSQTEMALGRETPTLVIPSIETARGVAQMGQIRWSARTPCVPPAVVEHRDARPASA